jgi:hypothetical protein
MKTNGLEVDSCFQADHFINLATYDGKDIDKRHGTSDRDLVRMLQAQALNGCADGRAGREAGASCFCGAMS